MRSEAVWFISSVTLESRVVRLPKFSAKISYLSFISSDCAAVQLLLVLLLVWISYVALPYVPLPLQAINENLKLKSKVLIIILSAWNNVSQTKVTESNFDWQRFPVEQFREINIKRIFYC